MGLEVVRQTLPLFLGMSLGFAASWWRPFRAAEPGITAFVFFIALPALLFTLTIESDLTAGLPWQFAVTIALSLALSMAVLWPVLRWSLRGHPANALHVAMAGSFGNVAYLGIPVVLGVLGTSGGLPAIVGQLLHNLVFLVAYPVLASVLLAVGDRSRRGAAPVGAAVRRATLQNPLLWSVTAGAAVTLLGIPLPSVVTDATSMFAAAAAPAALFAVGLTLRGALGAIKDGAAPIGPVVVATISKVVVLPALSGLLLLLLAPGIDPVWAIALVILAAMPTSASAFVLAGGPLADRQAVATVTLASNGIALVSVPVVAAVCLALLT